MSAARQVLSVADIRFPLERANGVQIVKTAAALAGRGAPTTLVVRRSDPRPTEEVLALYGVVAPPSLTVRRLPVLHRRGSFLLPRASFLARALVLASAAARRGAVLYTRDLQLADLLLALGAARKRLVYEAHAVEWLMYRERGALYGTAASPDPAKEARLRRREGRVFRRSGAFVTTTAGILESFLAEHGPRERTAVVPNGCDVPADRRFPGLPPADEPRVLYAGQLYPWKGVDVLLEAVASLPGVRLTVLGGLEGEADLTRVRERVRSLGLEGRTEMPGTVPQARVGHELARASVVAVPFLRSAMTERHTSPLKAFEAMAAGRPLVVTDLPSSRELLRDGENALLVPPGDVAALAAALSRLLADRPLAERLARTAFDEAPRYSWDSRAGRLLEIMEALP